MYAGVFEPMSMISRDMEDLQILVPEYKLTKTAIIHTLLSDVEMFSVIFPDFAVIEDRSDIASLLIHVENEDSSFSELASEFANALPSTIFDESENLQEKIGRAHV